MYEGEFRALYPDTSFPAQLTTEILDAFGADPVLEGPQEGPGRYQISYRDGVQQIDGQWFTKYANADMDDDAKAATDAAQAGVVRAQRKEKLNACDWTQLPDSPVDKQAWANYRQALRDISTQAGFPWDIEWPIEP